MSTTTQSRADLIGRYVDLDAIANLLHQLGPEAEQHGMDSVDRATEVLHERTDAFDRQIWPEFMEEEDDEIRSATPEWLLAEARALALTADWLTVLARDDTREYLLARASWFSRSAAEKIAEAQTLQKEDRDVRFGQANDDV